MVSTGGGITLIAGQLRTNELARCHFSVRSNSASLQIYILFMKHSELTPAMVKLLAALRQ